MKQSGKAVRTQETKRFERRRKELERAIGENQLARIAKEAEKLRAKARQLALFSEIDQELQKRLTDLDAELALRRNHYEQVQDRLAVEAQRTLEHVLPRRYALRGEARVYPIAVEIRLREAAR
jgi:ABC-type phosphate transport system auxiliary subunit